MKRLALGVALLAAACGSRPAPVIDVFTAAPASIALGGSAQLIFSAEAGATLSIDQGIGDVTGKTSVTVAPTVDTTYTLTAAKDVLGETVTSTKPVTVRVTPSPSAAFRLTAASGSNTAGVPVSFTLAALDSGGGVNANYRGTVRFSSDDLNAALPSPVTFAASDNGQKTVSATFRTAGSRTLVAADSVVASAQGIAKVQVAPAAATRIALTGTPDAIVAGDLFTVTVSAYDAFDNVATGFNGTVSFSSTDSSAQLPADYTYATLDNGAHAFPVVMTKAATGSTITVTSAGLTAQQGTLRVNPAAAAQVSVDGLASSVDVDVNTIVTVNVRDAFGNVASAYTGTVQVTSTDPQATGTGNLTFAAGDAGSKPVMLCFATAGTQSVSAVDSVDVAIAGATSTHVKHGAPVKLVVSGVAPTSVAGVPLVATVTAADAHGNVATDYAGTVHLSSTDRRAILPADTAFTGSGGVRNFPLALITAGAQSVTVSDVAGSLTPATTGVSVVNASAARVALVAHAPAIAVDTGEVVTATVLDAFGNPALDYGGTVHFITTDGAATPIGDVTFTPAMFATADVTAQFATAGAQSVMAADTVNGSISGSTAVTVTNGPATAYALSPLPTSAMAGEPLPLTIRALDAHGNLVVDYAGSAAVGSSDPSDRLPAAGGFVGGSRTVAVAFVTSGPHVATVSEVGGTIHADTSTVSVVSADAASFSVTGGAATAGANASATVTVKDTFGNTVVSYSGTVTFASSDANAVLPSSFQFGAGDRGQHTFAVSFHLSGDQSLSVTDGRVSGSATFTVSADVGVACDLLDLPATAGAGAQVALRVAVKDRFGNRATGYAGTVALSSTDVAASLGPPGVFTSIDAGVRAFTAQLRTAGAQAVSATDSGNASLTCAAPITVLPGATLLAVAFPGGAEAWAGTAVSVTVTAQDAFANRVSTYAGTVAFTSTDAFAARPPTTTFALSDNGQKTLSVTFNSIGSQTLTATDTVAPATTGAGSQTVHGLVYTNPASGGKVRLVLNSVGSSASVVQLDLLSNTTLFPLATLDPLNSSLALPSSARNGVFAAGMNLPLDTTKVGPDTTLLRVATGTAAVFSLGVAPQAVAATIANGVLYSGVSQKRVDLSFNCSGSPCTNDHLRGDVRVQATPNASSTYYSLRLRLTPGATVGTVFDGQTFATNTKFHAAVRDRSGSDVFSGTTDFAIGKLEVK